MTPHDPQSERADLVALYLSGAMLAEERAAFEARLRQDAALAAELSRFDPAVRAIADACPPMAPPKNAKEAILRRIREAGIPHVDLASEGQWRSSGIPGIERRVLYIDAKRGRTTALFRMGAGGVFPEHAHHAIEEVYVLEGDLRMGDRVFLPGDYVRHEPGTQHARQWSETGCVCMLILTAA